MKIPSFLAQTQAAAPEIKDIAPPIDVFPYPMWMVYTAAGVALLLLALVIWGIVHWFRHRAPKPPPTPREAALAALEQARARTTTLEPYAFSILVSDILRHYISQQYQLHATRQTSPEFLASISDSPKFTAQEKTHLAIFLDKCDLLKFAHMEATQDENEDLLEKASTFVKGGAV